MKTKYVIGIIAIALSLLLTGCANEISEDPLADIGNHTPTTTVDSSPSIEKIEETVDNEIIVEPISPITPIEPIEDFQLPECIENQLYFYSMEELNNYINSVSRISQDSETYALLSAIKLDDMATYYVIDSTKVPDGYEFIYAVLDANFIWYRYSSTPEAYEEHPWLWPEETTLSYYIYPPVYELNGRIRINGEIADGSDIVIKYTVGNSDHVTE